MDTTITICCICNAKDKYLDIDCECCRKSIQGSYYYSSNTKEKNICNVLCGGCKKNNKGYTKIFKEYENWVQCLYCQKSAHKVILFF